MKVILKVLEWVFFLITLVVIFLVASPMLPTKNSFATYVISSKSMYPAIDVGSVIFVKKADPENVQANDIIAFTNPDNLEQTIVHRVVEKKLDSDGKTVFLTKGDNNDVDDSWEVSEGLLKGTSLLVIPKLGILISSMKTAKGFLLILGVPALFLIALQIKRIKEGMEEEIERRTAEAIRHREEKTTTLTAVTLLLICSLQFYTLPKAYSLFSSSVTITGITLDIADFALKIDIKPGNKENPINLKSEGMVQVTVFGSEVLDVDNIDYDTVRFQKAEPEKWVTRKVDKDDREDIVFFFNVDDLEGLDEESTEARLDCEDKEGTKYYGTDKVWILHEENHDKEDSVSTDTETTEDPVTEETVTEETIVLQEETFEDLPTESDPGRSL